MPEPTVQITNPDCYVSNDHDKERAISHYIESVRQSQHLADFGDKQDDINSAVHRGHTDAKAAEELKKAQL